MLAQKASPEEQREALALLFSRDSPAAHVSRADEALEAARQGTLSLDGLFVVRRSGQLAGAALSVLQADGTLFVWPPVVRRSSAQRSFNPAPGLFAHGMELQSGRTATDGLESHPAVVKPLGGEDADVVADVLLQEIIRRADSADAWLSQAMVGGDDIADRQALSRNGFAHIADLLFLVRPLNEPLPPCSEIPFEAVAFNSPCTEDRFSRLIERTYVGTRDCPILTGTRSGTEALKSHRLAGEFDPSRWKIYQVDGVDVGVLLLADHPEDDAWEVVYMGIIPEARGRGLGRAVLLSGLHEARDAGRASMMLAVDSRNDYAVAVYTELGFLEAVRRSVHGRLSPARLRHR